MYCHYPKQIPDSEVYYEIIPGQSGTWDQPEYAPEIEFGDIEIKGVSHGNDIIHRNSSKSNIQY